MKPNYQKTLPQKADFVFTSEWWFSPVSTRIDNLFIAKDKSRNHWVLWLTWFDDNWLKDEERIITSIPIDGYDNANVAAMKLIEKFWKEENINGSLSYGPEFISQTGILDEQDIETLIKKVWG